MLLVSKKSSIYKQTGFYSIHEKHIAAFPLKKKKGIKRSVNV